MKGRKRTTRDSKKERIFRELDSILESAGLKVRREELKRGFGWKVMSGTCRLEGDQILFVDRRMTQDDQLSYLTGKIVSLGISLTEAQQLALDNLGWKLLDDVQAA